jgi:hypothetical protein
MNEHFIKAELVFEMQSRDFKVTFIHMHRIGVKILDSSSIYFTG